MAVRLPRGFRAGATRAGIKPSGKPDLALLVSGLPASWAYVATQNRAAAPSIHRGRAQVKAAGGIRNRETAIKLLEAGATRLGTSSGVALVKGEDGDGY